MIVPLAINVDALAQARYKCKVVLDQQDGDALPMQGAKSCRRDVAKELGLCRGGLIQQDKHWVEPENLRKFDEFALSVTQPRRACVGVIRQAEVCKNLHRTCGSAVVTRLCHNRANAKAAFGYHDVLDHGQARKSRGS